MTDDRGQGVEGSRGQGRARSIEAALSRRSLFGAVAGVLALVASIGRKERKPTAVEQRRRRRFWIGHT